MKKYVKSISGTFEGEQADLKKGGFGLNNVAQRLRMYYGDQAEILVESEKGIRDPALRSSTIKKLTFSKENTKICGKPIKNTLF